VPLDEPDPKIGVYTAWRKRENSAAVLAFLNTVRRVFRIAPPERRWRESSGRPGLQIPSAELEA